MLEHPGPTPRTSPQHPAREAPRVNDIVAGKATLSWVNVLLGWIWPKANTALFQWVRDDLTPRLQDSLPSPFKKAHFSRFTLGQNTPEFGPIEVIRHSDTHVEVDLDMRYIADVDMVLDAGAGGVTLGVNRITFEGRLCLSLQPIMERSPVIGAVKMFFASCPEVKMRFTGLAEVAHIPGIQERVETTVNEWLFSSFILPKSKLFLYTHEEGINFLEAYNVAPVGVLRAKVLRARNLAGVNWQALGTGTFTSDPYCLLKIGAAEARTSTVSRSTNPQWPASEPGEFFVVHHREQRLEIQVKGEDNGGLFTRNFTAFLGQAPSASVFRMMTDWRARSNQDGVRTRTVTLDTSQVSRDMLHVDDPVNLGIPSELDLEIEWFDLKDLRQMGSAERRRRSEASSPTGTPVALLIVEIHKGIGFPTEAFAEKKGLRWRCRVEGQESVMSQRGQLCDMEEIEFPELPIHRAVFPVIDRLRARGFPSPEIAQVTGIHSAELVDIYLLHKEAYMRKHQELQQTYMHEDHRVNLQWYENVPLFVRRPASATLTLDLLDGEDREVGGLAPLPLRQLIESNEGALPLDTYGLHTLEAGSGRLTSSSANVGGGFANMFKPRPAPLDVERFLTVQLQVSAQMRFLTPANNLPGPGDDGASLAAAATTAAAAAHAVSM